MAGEDLGTKIDTIHEPKALAANNQRGQMRQKDPNDPSWLVKQSCWSCGKMGHIQQKCVASQSEKDEFRDKKLRERGAMATESSNAGTTGDDVEVYAKAMIAKDFANVARSNNDLPK